MAEKTNIEWTDSTWNPWFGCSKVSAGCTNCYAETMARRNPAILGEWGPRGARRIAAESSWRQPLKWDREARAAGVRHRVFCASMADFAEARPELIEPRRRLFQLIGQTPALDWLLLTKRPEVARENWPLWAGYWASVQEDRELVLRVARDYVLPNVWLGVSVEDQPTADERIPILIQIPAAVRFLSCEPLLGPIEFSDVSGRSDAVEQLGRRALAGINWVILGGESGPHARTLDVAWVRSIVGQCDAAGVKVFVKQASGGKPGMPGDIPDDLWGRKEFPEV